jgi:hypothetical protein
MRPYCTFNFSYLDNRPILVSAWYLPSFKVHVCTLESLITHFTRMNIGAINSIFVARAKSLN